MKWNAACFYIVCDGYPVYSNDYAGGFSVFTESVFVVFLL